MSVPVKPGDLIISDSRIENKGARCFYDYKGPGVPMESKREIFESELFVVLDILEYPTKFVSAAVISVLSTTGDVGCVFVTNGYFKVIS